MARETGTRKANPRRLPRQLTLVKTGGWGGKRKGAGRRRDPKSGVMHTRRAKFSHMPVHVTLRVLPHVWNLRSRRCFNVIARAFFASQVHRAMRICHFSVQGNHIHLIVEADSKADLARCMQGLEVRLAFGLNSLMQRRGTVFADRYHSHLLRTPSEVRNAVGYVVDNHGIHARRAGRPPSTVADVYSSAAYAALDVGLVIALRPATWLLRRASARP